MVYFGEMYIKMFSKFSNYIFFLAVEFIQHFVLTQYFIRYANANIFLSL